MRLFRRSDADPWWCDFWHTGRRILERALARPTAKPRKSTRNASKATSGDTPDLANVRPLRGTPRRALSDRKDQLRFASTWLKGLPLIAIDRDTLDALGKKKAATGVGPATVNRCMAAVSAVLGHAFKKGWIPAKPPIPKRDEPGKRVRWATRAQARALLAALPGHLAAMAEFSLTTGLRQHNVTHLEWSQIDLGRRVAWICADQAKGKRDFAVPLSDGAALVLQRQLGAHAKWVFPYRGGPIKQPTQVAWQTATEVADLTGFRWHDLRHTWRAGTCRTERR